MSVFSQAPGVTAEMSGDKIVALDAEGQTMVTLNAVGAIIWNHLDEPRNVIAIVHHMQASFPDVAVERLEADAMAFVEELLDAGLLVAADD